MEAVTGIITMQTHFIIHTPGITTAIGVVPIMATGTMIRTIIPIQDGVSVSVIPVGIMAGDTA